MSLIPCTYKWFYFGQSNYNKITQTHDVALRQYKCTSTLRCRTNNNISSTEKTKELKHKHVLHAINLEDSFTILLTQLNRINF